MEELEKIKENIQTSLAEAVKNSRYYDSVRAEIVEHYAKALKEVALTIHLLRISK